MNTFCQIYCMEKLFSLKNLALLISNQMPFTKTTRLINIQLFSLTMSFGILVAILPKKGFVNTLEGMIKNTNYEAKNTTDYKTEGTVNELSGVLTYKSSLPMQKERN